MTVFFSFNNPCRSKRPAKAKAAVSLGRRLLAALLAARRARALDDAEDFVLAHDEVLVAVDLYLRAAVLAEEHSVAGLYVERDALAVVLALAVADGDDLPPAASPWPCRG